MFERKVLNIVKNAKGEIVSLKNPFEYWSPRKKHDVISDLETKFYKYYIHNNINEKIFFEVVDGHGGKDLELTSKLLDSNILTTRPHTVF